MRRCFSNLEEQPRRGRAEFRAYRGGRAIGGTVCSCQMWCCCVDRRSSSYQLACLLILLDLDSLKEVVDLLVLAPVFGVLELLEGFLRHEATRAQESTAYRQHPAPCAPEQAKKQAYSIVSSSWLASAVSVAGV